MNPLTLAALIVILISASDTASQSPGELTGRQPYLAAHGQSVAMTFGRDGDIWMTMSLDAGRHFAAPVKVAHVPDLMLGRHRGPRIVIAGQSLVVTATSGGKIGDLLAWRSTNGGSTWLGPVTVNDQARAADEGLHAMAVNDKGQIGVVWLDARTPGKKLYAAYSQDDGKTWSSNQKLYQSPSGAICSCCDPSIAPAASGKFAVMFRNVLDGNRDLYAFHWTPGDNPTPAEKVGTGSWHLDACPMDGGGVADRGGSLASAWRRDHTVILALQGQPELELGTGRDVSLATTPAGAYVAWVDTTGVVMLHTPSKRDPETLAANGSFPSLAALADGSVLAAWEEQDSIHSRLVAPVR